MLKGIEGVRQRQTEPLCDAAYVQDVDRARLVPLVHQELVFSRGAADAPTRPTPRLELRSARWCRQQHLIAATVRSEVDGMQVDFMALAVAERLGGGKPVSEDIEPA